VMLEGGKPGATQGTVFLPCVSVIGGREEETALGSVPLRIHLLWCHPPSPVFAGAGLSPGAEPCLCLGKAQVEPTTSPFVVTLLLFFRPLLRPVIYKSQSQ